MIAKRIQPSTWFKDEPLSQLIKVHSKGAEMQKLAACDSPLARANIRPEKGHAFIQLITTGAGERYGCFFKGAPVQTPDGFTEIQDLQVGDPVMTHKGRYQQISNTFQDRYKGTKVSIKVTGIPVPIESTDNHPFLVVRNKDLSSGLRCYYKKKDTLSEYMAGVLDKASFVAAEDIELGDYMLTPIGNISEDPWEFPPYLLGLYVADGCLFKEYRDIRSKGDVKGVVYTLSKSKRACIDVIQEWRASEEKAAVSVREHGEVLRIQITHKAFADACAMFGASAQTKTIPAGMFKGSVEDRMLFLAGYLDGDGCRAIGKEAGAVRCSTISLELAMDLRRLAASVGLPMVVSACWNRESNGAFGKGDNQIFSCTIPSSYAGVLNKYCRRLKKLGSAKRKATTQYIQDGYIMSAVTHLEYQSVDTTKYNIEVDGDNTYVVLVAGHNSNSNADYFNKTACLWVYPNPISQTRKEEMLSGGLLSYHNTFMKYGAVYREHNNSKKGASPEGQIVLEAYNPHMDRGELIVKVGEDKWASELSDLEAGRPVYFSMGCYTAGALVQMTDGSLKEIQDVFVGDTVFTHTGKSAEVTGIRRLDKEGEPIYTVRASGHLDLVCTGNHEQFTIRKEHKRTKDVVSDAKWVRTDDLQVGDWLVCPIPKLGAKQADEAFALLAGWYVAEGDLKIDTRSTTKVIRLSTGLKDSLYLCIDELCEQLGTVNKPCVYEEPEVNRRSIHITDEKLYTRLLPFGRGAHNKVIPPEVFTWDKDSVLAFLSGYLSGDGCFYTIKNKSRTCNLFASTASKQLAVQIQRIGLALGGFVSVSKAKHHTSKSAPTSLGYTISYQMRFDATLTALLAPHITKVTSVPNITRYGRGSRRIQGGYAMYKISRIDVEVMTVPVYNLHVDSDDHSYIVNGLATHNCGVKHDKCSICGNHASTRANYCQHLRYDKLAMDKEGNQVFAINDEPHFHDISKVVKPADRIAFGLAKVASGGYVSDDEEDLSSLWMPMSVITKLSGETEQKRASILDKLSAMEKKILAQGLTPEEDTLAGSFEDMSQEEEEDLVEKLAAYPIESVLTCLNNNKVMLPPRVFACILLHKRASEVPGLGDMTKALRNIFSELRESGDTEILQDGTYSQRSRMMGPSHEIQKIAGRFSLDDSAVERRVIRSIIAGSEKTAGLADTTSAESRYLAREYAKYQMSFVTGAGLEKNAHLIVLHNQVAT